MRRVVLVLPELTAASPDESVLRQPLTYLTRFAEAGQVGRLLPIGEVETPEAVYLGLPPSEGQLRPGPLMVSALGANPPERSTHFILSLLSSSGERVEDPSEIPTPDETRVLMDAAKRLNTKVLTVLAGEEKDHGLVWEGLGDMRTFTPREATELSWREALPQGDADRELRRFIDDSVNILMDLEFNRQRLEEGRPPFNVLWPWGEGLRLPVPNLALRRGTPLAVETESFRMAGLARLAGYRPGRLRAFRTGMNLNMERLAERILAEEEILCLISGPEQLREREKLEELEWFVRQIDDRLLKPIWDRFRDEVSLNRRAELTIVAPSRDHPGLTLLYSAGSQEGGFFPFDERSLDERKVSTWDTAQVVDRVLGG
jgi:hypothetical protein